MRSWLVVATSLALVDTGALAQEQRDVVELRSAVAVEPAGRRGRVAVAPDAVQASIAAGRWTTPSAGEILTMPDGSERVWSDLETGDDGWFGGRALRGGWVSIRRDEPRERVALLHAIGHSTVYVNGEPRAGDPYRTGFVRVPVRLDEGVNELLFSVSRGRLRARLEEPPAAVSILPGDDTLPDLVAGVPIDAPAAVLVANATIEAVRGLRLRVAIGPDGGLGMATTELPDLPPLSVRKVRLDLRGTAPPAGASIPLRLELIDVHGPSEHVVLHQAERSLAVRGSGDLQSRTFVSAIDGSVQYYAIRPASERDEGAETPGIVLTLHGAGVEGRGQAACYASRPWCNVVAPTNRRPFGFDWEDWGRLDALEVLELATRSLDVDPRRTWLTGHSMGGHGTWNLGVHFPDRFAAIAPSAGWISFWSYTGAERYADADPVERLLRRATTGSDTLALSRNFAQQGVYVLHGDRDDNVPVEQARTMREHLGGFHPDFAYYERPGAGHWWGNQCVDWPPLMEFLQRRRLPAAGEPRRVEFVTASPGISATCHWVTIHAQQRILEPSRVAIELEPDERRFQGSTENVERLALELSATPLAAGEPVTIELDGSGLLEVPWPEDGTTVQFGRGEDDAWSSVQTPDPRHKGPHRCGPFKDAFRHRVVFVYGTRGSDAENRWAFAKARYDAETFWYRGNGSIDVIADTSFDPGASPDRSVVLYGNADTNAAWAPLLGDGPVLVAGGRVMVGDRVMRGDALGVLLVRPRPGSDVASVAVVGGSGLHGMRLTERLPYFVSGVGYPDVTILGPEALETGVAGVRVAGYFGNDWSVEKGDFAFRP